MARFTIGLLAAVLVLGLPATALAQSAGDDQYADPFGDTEQPQEQPQGGGGQPQGGEQPEGGDQPQGGDQPVDNSGSAPQPAPEPAAPEPAQTTVQAAPSQEGGTLPRTGSEVVLLLAAAFPLVVGGLALRRVAR